MRRTLGLCLTCFVFLFFPFLVNAHPRPAKTLSSRTVPAVAISLTNGRTFTIPADHPGVTHPMIAAIPLAGNDNVIGLRVEPYLSGNLVGVHVDALLGERGAFQKSALSCAALQTWKSRSVGSYVIGGTGESLQLADLAKFGLPALRVSVVQTTFTPATEEDGCCECDDGTTCCPLPGHCFTRCGTCGICCTK